MNTISILDFGLSNCGSVRNMFSFLNQPSNVITSIDELEQSSALVIPGVGTFDEAMNRLTSLKLAYSIEQLSSIKNLPILGICLGMQLLLENS